MPHIVRRSPTANSRLVFGQTAVAHKEYFDYVYSFGAVRAFPKADADADADADAHYFF
jgi:hypothetical protein